MQVNSRRLRVFELETRPRGRGCEEQAGRRSWVGLRMRRRKGPSSPERASLDVRECGALEESVNQNASEAMDSRPPTPSAGVSAFAFWQPPRRRKPPSQAVSECPQRPEGPLRVSTKLQTHPACVCAGTTPKNSSLQANRRKATRRFQHFLKQTLGPRHHSPLGLCRKGQERRAASRLAGSVCLRRQSKAGCLCPLYLSLGSWLAFFGLNPS